MKHAIVLCSGGLDSVTTAFLAQKLKYNLTLLFFNYSQNSLAQEKSTVKYFAKKLKADFKEINISNLVPKNPLNSKIKISLSKSLKNTSTESKNWYVPQRNLIFLSTAASFAESFPNKKVDLFVGFKCEGSESYPDTTLEFVKNFNKLIKKSTSGKVSLKTPLIKKDKEDIIQLGKKLDIELEKTFSCYSPKNNLHCGICLACRLRRAGFYWANKKDKTNYSATTKL